MDKGSMRIDVMEKLQYFYKSCNNLPRDFTHEEMLNDLYNHYDKSEIEEALKNGVLTDEALKALREHKFTYNEIAVLFGEKAAALRQRSRRLRPLS